MSFVIELTPKDFDKNGKIIHKKQGGKMGLISFTAPWCGHCRSLKKPYSETAKIMGGSFPMFNVDCEKYKDLGQKMKIQGFPTIKYVNREGTIGQDYISGRSIDEFLEDICKKSQQCRR
jgi:protein disulfide-isomerase A6